MGRGVLGEEHIAAHFDDLLQLRVQAEVGVIIGKQSVGARDLLFSLIRTPSQDGQEPVQCTSAAAKQGGGKQGSKPAAGKLLPVTLQLDEEWVVEHARQVARMLPGGLSVVGLYLFAPDSGYQSSLNQLCSALSALCQGQPPPPDADGKQGELLLLHVDSGSKKTSLRSGGGSGGAAALKVCELKYGNPVSSLVRLTCRHAVHLSLPTPAPLAQLQQEAERLVAAESHRISCAVSAINGALPASEELPLLNALPEADATANAASSSSCALLSYEVELLLPLPAAAPASSSGRGGKASSRGQAVAAGRASAAGGLVALSGELVGVSFAHKREPLSRAVGDLQADLQRTLAVRLELLVEEALRDEEEAATAAAAVATATAVKLQDSGKAAAAPAAAVPRHPLLGPGRIGRGHAFALPRRVLLPWRGGLQLCDYLMPGESVAAALERAEELLALCIQDPAMVVEVEQHGQEPGPPTPWQPTASPDAQQCGQRPGMFAQQGVRADASLHPSPMGSLTFPHLAAAIAALAVIIGLAMAWATHAANRGYA